VGRVGIGYIPRKRLHSWVSMGACYVGLRACEHTWLELRTFSSVNHDLFELPSISTSSNPGIAVLGRQLLDSGGCLLVRKFT
jgi:hypothetical protein